MNEFFKQLSWFTIATGIISVIAAVITFLLTRLSLRDGRKTFLGLKGKAVKEYAAYVTLVFAFLTLFIQNRHDFKDSEEKRIKQNKDDSTQRANMTTTLSAIGKTLAAQKVTQDSTQRILNQQKAELKNGDDILSSEKKSLDNYIALNKGQQTISNGVGQNISLTKAGNKTQEKTVGLVDTGFQKLNYPLKIALTFKMRIYVDGLADLWKDSISGTHQILKQNNELKPFIQSYIGKLPVNDQISYWQFFFFCVSAYGYDHAMFLDSKLTRIRFAEGRGVHSGSGMYTATCDVYVNSKDGYFEIPMQYNEVAIETNSENLNNFAPLINNSTLFLKLKYSADRDIKLPVMHGKTVTIRINHIAISETSLINYGNDYQSVLPANGTLIPENEKPALIKSLWHDNSSGDDLWRYTVVQIPVKK